jgi:ribosomal protein L12E/L44/L45/RPP1/RPP2
LADRKPSACLVGHKSHFSDHNALREQASTAACAHPRAAARKKIPPRKEERKKERKEERKSEREIRIKGEREEDNRVA